MDGTKDAIERFRLPDAPNAEGGDIVLALSQRLLPLSIRKRAKGAGAQRSDEAHGAGRRAATEKMLAGRFASVKHTFFPALEAGTASTSALFGTRRWSIVSYEKVEPGIARTLAAVSSGPLGESIPLQPLTETARSNFYDLQDGIKTYLEASFSSKRTGHSSKCEPNPKRTLAQAAPLQWVSEAQEAIRLRAGPTKAAIVGVHGLPLTRWFPYRVDKAQGALFMEYTPEIDAYVQSPPLPVIKQPRSEPRVLKPSVPPDWETGYLASRSDYLDVLQPEARRKYFTWLKEYRRNAAEIEAQACGSGTTHRIGL